LFRKKTNHCRKSTSAEITGFAPGEIIEAMLENKETAKAYAIIIDVLSIEKDLGQMTA
jgi:hypothetical protein